MSIFKSKWIILKKVIYNWNSDIIYTIFSYDYWKIQAVSKTSKKEKTLDLWNLIDFEIETNEKSKINKIKNIKISSIFMYEWQEYKIIEQYLKIINIILKYSPEWLRIMSIFESIEFLHKQENLEYWKLLLLELKIINILWILNLEHKDEIIKKILNFIDKNNINTIFLLEKLNSDILEKLENIKY